MCNFKLHFSEKGGAAFLPNLKKLWYPAAVMMKNLSYQYKTCIYCQTEWNVSVKNKYEYYICPVCRSKENRERNRSKCVTNKIEPVKRLYQKDVIRILNAKEGEPSE